MRDVHASRSLRLVLGCLLLCAAATARAQDVAPAEPKRAAQAAPGQAGHVATTPAPRADAWWTERHAAQVRQLEEGHAELLFLGDSITQGWEGPGKDEWAKRYARHHAVNLGISGDRTQHVLWRLDNGILAALRGRSVQPKAIVVMIGTNNSNGDDHTAEQIADGIAAIVRKLREGLPKTKVLLLAVFPRGESPNAQREKNARASEIVSKLADGKDVHFLDIGGKFLGPNGALPKDVMPDFLHLSPKGYAIWAEAIEEKLAELMK